MIHILLTILKILGIAILVILGLILAIILIVLLVPIRYRVTAGKQDDIDGKVRVSWLFGLIAFVLLYREKKMDIQLRLLGINLMKLLKKEKKPKKSSKSQTKEQDQEIFEETETVDVVKENTESVRVESNEKEPSEQQNNPVEESISKEKEKVSLKQKLTNIFNSVRERIQKLKLTITNVCGKIKYWKEFVADKRVKDALLLVKDKLFKILKHILPKKLAGEVIYGFDDPCQTGQVLAGLSVFYPVYYKHLKVIPDFNGSVMKGHLKLKGRIYLGYLLIAGLSIILNKNILYIINTFRNKEAS